MVRGCGEGAGAQGPRASIALRSGAVGIRARDGSASRPDARGAARAPAGLGHHPVGAEVGVAGGAGDGRPPRDPGSRRGGAGDARLRGGGASADPGLGPGDPPPPPGEREWHGGGGVPASGEPRPGPAAPHPLRAGQHDAHCFGGMAERGADEDPPQPKADRSVLPERAGAAPPGARHGGGAAHGGAGTGGSSLRVTSARSSMPSRAGAGRSWNTWNKRSCPTRRTIRRRRRCARAGARRTGLSRTWCRNGARGRRHWGWSGREWPSGHPGPSTR